MSIVPCPLPVSVAFKFRLEASLGIAQQRMDAAQVVLSQEMRVLQEIQRELDIEKDALKRALEGQGKDALQNPRRLSGWNLHIDAQKDKLNSIAERLSFQGSVVEECREALKECRVMVEKFKRLKEKKWKEFVTEDLKKEQASLDEIGQRSGRE